MKNGRCRMHGGPSTGPRTPEGLERYLCNIGVQYVVLEKRGYGVVELDDLAAMKKSRLAIYQKLADFGAYLRTHLDELARRGRVLYSDERMLIFELGPGRPPSPPESAAWPHIPPQTTPARSRISLHDALCQLP